MFSSLPIALQWASPHILSGYIHLENKCSFLKKSGFTVADALSVFQYKLIIGFVNEM